jgi:hypothetical protein
MELFFYGTLMDEAVRRLVLGPTATDLRLTPASLAGYRRVAKPRETAPMLRRHQGGLTRGLLCQGLDEAAMARLWHFEGADYRLGPVLVRRAERSPTSALAFLAANPRPAGSPETYRSEIWRLEIWQRRHKRSFLRRMALWMAARPRSARSSPAHARQIKRYAGVRW